MRTSVLSLAIALLLSLTASALAQPPAPPLPLPGVRLLPVLEIPEGATVENSWSAQNAIDDAGAIIAKQSTAPAELLTLDGRPVLKLTCNFAGTDIPRGVWDRAVDLDLTRATAICFDVYAENLSALRTINLYLRSGDGWYGAYWYPEEEGLWCRIRLPRSEFYIDKPGSGWSEISTIRFSPWAGAREDAVLHIANFAVEEAPLSAAVVLPSYTHDPAKLRAATKYANTVSAVLDAAGCPLPMLSTSDLTPESMASLKLIVLPHTAGASAEDAELLAQFIRDGGKVIALYSTPAPLAQALGVRQKDYRSRAYAGEFATMRFATDPPSGAPAQVQQASWGIIDSEAVAGIGEVAAWWHDQQGERTDAPAIITSADGVWFSHILLDDDPAAKGRLLVALAEHFVPGTADVVAQRRIALMGGQLHAEDWDAALTAVRAQPAFGNPSETLVQQAQATRTRAIDATDPFESIALANEAERLLVEAFCRAQATVANEFRATWCHPPEGISGWGWPKTADRLREAGIDHLLLNALHGTSAAYPSAVLPFDKSNTEGVDYLQQAIDACSERGIAVHVWMTNFKAGGHAPPEDVERFEQEGRIAVQLDGQHTDTLCPTDPRNQNLQISAMVEVAHRPGVSGIHFDYIRYPSGKTCFCDGCRKRFGEFAGVDLPDWPTQVLAGGDLREQWLDFRRASITRVVREVSETVRREVPDCMISAAVFRNYPQCRDDVAQDWVAWANEGYVDFLCPMNYTASDTQFRETTAAQLKYLDAVVPCYPGIGLLKGLGPVGACRQVRISRELGTGGFVIWSVYSQYIDDVYPYLGMSLLAGDD